MESESALGPILLGMIDRQLPPPPSGGPGPLAGEIREQALGDLVER